MKVFLLTYEIQGVRKQAAVMGLTLTAAWRRLDFRYIDMCVVRVRSNESMDGIVHV